MFESAYLKIDRATEHIDELNELFRNERPFSYVLETNTKTGERATFAKKNKPIIDRCGILIGDSVHNMRAALDHAYWEAVSPHIESDRGMDGIQFPFSKTQARLDEAVKNRLAHRVSDRFFSAIIAMQPHGELGGNKLLYMIHEFDIVDKHKLLIPTADYKKLTSTIIAEQMPGFPPGFVDCGFGQNGRDVVIIGRPIPRAIRRARKLPEIFEQELSVPVDIVFQIGPDAIPRPVIPTLYALRDVTKQIVSDISSAI